LATTFVSGSQLTANSSSRKYRNPQHSIRDGGQPGSRRWQVEC
jgi:hypothetical protein